MSPSPSGSSAQEIHNIGLMVGLPLAARKDDAITSPQPVCAEWALALACHSYPPNVNVKFFPVKSRDVAGARNVIVQAAFQFEAKYLWFLDSDVEAPHFAVRRLIYDLEQNLDAAVAGGIYCAKQMPTEPLVFNGNGHGSYWDWKEGDLFPVTGIATGCMMIRTEVFKKIEPPWFVSGERSVEMDNQPGVEFFTEDMYFCRKVTAAGMKILADGGVLCTHWDIEKGIPYRLTDDSYPMRKNGDGK